MALFEQGLEVEVQLQTGWTECQVVFVRPEDGAVQIDVVPDHWITKRDQAGLLRFPQFTFTDTHGQFHAILVDGKGLQWQADPGQPMAKIAPVRWLVVEQDVTTGGFHIGGPFGQASVADPPPGPMLAQLLLRLSHTARVQGLFIGGSGMQHVHPDRVAPARPMSFSPFSPGQAVEFWSGSYSCWMPCQVLDVDQGTACIQVSAKPGVWLTQAEQSAKVKMPHPEEHAAGMPPPPRPPGHLDAGEAPPQSSEAHDFHFTEKKGQFLSGTTDDQVFMSVEEAKNLVMSAPEAYMGYTIGEDGVVYTRKIGSTMMEFEGWNSFLISCKAINYDGPLFEDDFCTNLEKFSGGFENGKGGEPWAVWKRPGRGEGLYDMSGMKLFGGVSPNDAVQGGVGDCSLIAVIAALCEFPSSLYRIFGSRKVIAEDGRYDMNLWDWQKGDWTVISIDDRFAVKDADAIAPCFAKMSKDDEIFAMLIEKAVSVMAGGFDFMSAIMPTWAFGVLTGCHDVFEFHRAPGTCQWTGFRAEFDGTTTYTFTQHHENVWPGGEDGNIPHGDPEMWQTLKFWDDRNYLTCCGVSAHGKTDAQQMKGIFYMHAYSMIQVQCNIAGSGINLVQLRNPHGQSEPDLPWKDGHANWQQYPQVAQALGWGIDKQVNDGTFWVQDVDYFTYWNTVYLVKCDMERKRAKCG